MGGGKGGSDFDPNKSDAEVMRLSASLMTELARPHW